jgi:hypothetical protein
MSKVKTWFDWPFVALIGRGTWDVQLQSGGPWYRVHADTREQALTWARRADDAGDPGIGR